MGGGRGHRGGVGGTSRGAGAAQVRAALGWPENAKRDFIEGLVWRAADSLYPLTVEGLQAGAECLFLNHNQLTAAAMVPIAAALAAHDGVLELSLRGNPIGADGVRALFAALREEGEVNDITT